VTLYIDICQPLSYSFSIFNQNFIESLAMSIFKKAAAAMDSLCIKGIYEKCYFDRRTKVLANCVGAMVPENARVLDIGCGNGQISSLIVASRPGIDIKGIDIMKRREKCFIPVEVFDGKHIPYDDNSFDTALFVDVLHHIPDPMTILREAARVARKCIVIKDHNADRLLGDSTLQFMDWVGNARYGVVLEYNYLKKPQWETAFAELGLTINAYNNSLHLYPGPVDWIFGRSLQFVCCLDVGK
jgi:ubiquinone/menaquinone biosynthesis C-methylase UbiE